MNFKYLVITFIMALVSACNVAEQSPKVDTTAQNNASSNTNVNLANDNQVISFRHDQANIAESNSSLTINIDREGTYIPENQIIYIKILGTSADLNDLNSSTGIQVNGSNVNFVSADTFEVPFSGSSLSQSIKIKIYDDLIYEQDEILELQLVENPTKDYVFAATSSMGILIQDNEVLPKVLFDPGTPTSAGSPGTVVEGAIYTASITLTHASKYPVIVPVSIGNSSIASSSDHDFVNTNYTIDPGQLTPTSPISIQTTADASLEINEMLVLEIGNPINALQNATDQTHYIEIQEASSATYSITTADTSISENGGDVDITLKLNPTLTGALENQLDVPITISTVSGNIFKNVDYTIGQLYFSFPAGSTGGDTATIKVTGINDFVYEGDNETIKITVGDTDFVKVSTVAGENDVQITVTDDDDLESPKVQFASSNFLTQEGASFYVPVYLSAPSSTNWLSALSSTLDDDPNATVTYSNTPNHITIDFSGVPAAGTTLVFATDSGDQTFTYGTDYCVSACADEAAVVTALVSALEANTAFKNHYTSSVQSTDNTIVYISGPVYTKADQDIVFNYTVTGTSTSTVDHSLVSGSFTIPAGTESVGMPLMIYTDTINDQNETLIINITSVNLPGALGSSSTTTLTIKEEGSLPTITFDSQIQSATESATPINIGLTVSNANEYDQNISLTLQDNSTEKDSFNNPIDYSALSTTNTAECTVAGTVLTLKANKTTCTLSMTLTQDSIDEPTEQFEIKIQQPNNLVLGTYAKHIVNILDADAPPSLKISTDNSSTFAAATSVTSAPNEGDSETISFYLSTVSGHDVIINYADNSATAANPASTPDDYAITTTGTVLIPAGQLEATISLTTYKDNMYESGGTPEDIVITAIAGNNYTLDAQDEVTLSIKDEDVNTPPILRVKGLNVLTANENDIVNVTFELLDSVTFDPITTETDITVQYTVDDTVACAAAVTLNPNEYKCANIYTAPGSTDSQSLYSQLTGATGEVSIPAGSSLGVVSFTLDVDNLFENSKHTTLGIQYTRMEQFRIKITDILDSPSGVSVAGQEASIDADNFVDINIIDLDVVPVAFYSSPFFKSQSEASPTVSIPINVTSRSETAITYHIQIIQQADTNYNLTDENDFTYLIGADPVVTTFGNLEASSTIRSEDDTTNSPAYPNSGLLYTGASNIIFEGQFTIPALATTKTLEIQIEDDDLYEGNEQFIAKIVDDPNESTYGWQVSYFYNEFKVSILESSAAPTVTLSTVPASTIAEGTHTPTSDIVNALTAPDPKVATDALSYTNAAFTFTVSPISQHNQVSVEFLLSGTAVYNEDGFDTPNEYMRDDYFAIYDTIGLTGTNATDFTVSSSSSSFTATIPAGSGFKTDEFNYQIAQDYKYEPIANTIITTLANLVNVNSGAVMSHTITLTDTDSKPYLYLSNISSAVDTFKEYETDHDVTLLIADSGQVFTGSEITESPTQIDFKLSPNYYTTGVQSSTQTIDLNSLNNFTETLDIKPNVLGDFRSIDEIDFEFNTFSEVLPLSAATSYSDGTKYAINWDLTVNDIKVAISRGGSYKNSNTELHGHICTLFRGQVSCAGLNDNGQLGRGNTTNWGGTTGELVYDQTNVIDIGTDLYGNPKYAIDIATGSLHTCIILSTNEVKCWGDNTYGQLGVGLSTSTDIGISSSQMGNALTTVDLGTTETVVSIHAGYWHTCVLLSDNNVKCWGRNANGESGTNTSGDLIGDESSDMGANLKSIDTSDARDQSGVARTIGNIEQIVTGGYSTCLRDDQNYVYCWGYNGSSGAVNTTGNFGILGWNTTSVTQIRIKTPVVIGRTNLKSISAGASHYCANYSTSSFNTRCWGNNTHGQLGTGAGAYYGRYINNIPDAPSDSSRIPSNGYGLYSIGRYNAAYTYRALTINGHSTYSNTLYNFLLPSNATTGSYIDLGVSNNQFVQIEQPGRNIAASNVSTCGVFDKYYDTAFGGLKNELHVRCWGSNIYGLFNYRIDTGLVSNRSWSMWYPETAEDLAEPIVSSNGWSGTDSCDDTSTSATCKFIWRRAIIGDDNWGRGDSNTDPIIKNYVTSLTGTTPLTGTYSYGWAFTDVGTLFNGKQLNFELNTEYAKHKVNFSSYSDIELVGGNVNICALPKETTPTIANNKVRCWGANWAGQVGIDLSTGCYAGAIGSRWSCGVGKGQTHTYNYTYSP